MTPWSNHEIEEHKHKHQSWSVRRPYLCSRLDHTAVNSRDSDSHGPSIVQLVLGRCVRPWVDLQGETGEVSKSEWLSGFHPTPQKEIIIRIRRIFSDARTQNEKNILEYAASPFRGIVQLAARSTTHPCRRVERRCVAPSSCPFLSAYNITTTQSSLSLTLFFFSLSLSLLNK